jgi:hypothetical protein
MRPKTRNSFVFSQPALLATILAIVAAGAFSGRAREGQKQENLSANPRQAIEIVEHGGYPELRVEGEPFFIRSAAFFYYRTPRDQWERTLTTYRSLGINTIDLYIPWNWHELKEGDFDFDGHTNPRRDLRSLLALIAYQRLRLIARPGPEILNEWKNGGYPDWLLERPEYQMALVDRLEGRYSPLDELNPRDAEAAARGWIENTAHMEHARKWLSEVGKELAPYAPLLSDTAGTVEADKKNSETSRKRNTLLFVQLGDDFAEGPFNHVGSNFWRYLESLREAIAAAGADVPVFINPTDMRVPAAGSAQSPPIGVMGQWYLRPQAGVEAAGQFLSAREASDIEFFTEQLKTQPAFPPMMMEYQAGWYAPGDDDHPADNPPDNSVLSSRLLIANGIHGLNYFPLQDTISAAGESVPWANRSYRWNAAFSPDGEGQPRLRAVERDSYFFASWGPQLAASHKRADFGIVNPVESIEQDKLSRPDIVAATKLVMRLERLGALAMLSSEILDPQHQPAEQMLRNPVVVLPVLDSSKPELALSERAQHTIVEYVRRGGTLIIFPSRPTGRVLDEMWKGARPEPEPKIESAIRARWKFGEGELIESSKDFLSRIALDRSLSENREQRETNWAIGVLQELLAATGIRPTVKISEKSTGADDLIATEIVSNEGSASLGKRTGGRGFVSVTNLSSDDTVDATLEALSPAAGARGTGQDYIPMRVNLPPRESLLLPLNAPICKEEADNTPCVDEVTSGGAEFLDARREGRSLSLLFYTPAREEVHFHFDAQPSRVTIDDNKPEMNWDAAKRDLEVFLPRGPAPRYHRVLKIDLPYKARVPENEKARKQSLQDLTFVVANAVRLPTSNNAFLRTYPPLIVADSHGAYGVLVQGESHLAGELQIVNISIEGPFRGSGYIRVLPEGPSVEKIPVRMTQKDSTTQPASGKVLQGTMELRLGRDRLTMPVAFLETRDGGSTNYRFDFDRDGADEWVLENAGLRLIVSPESGGRAIALMDKVTGLNLSTSVGLLRDNFSFSENPAGINPERARGRYGLFNRPYSAEWASQETNPALKMKYDAPDIFPFGASIEKSALFEGADTLRVDYRVALRAARENKDISDGTHAQSFVAVNSFPARAEPGQVTRVCWVSRSSMDPGDQPDKNSADPGEKPVCRDFVPGGKTIEVPEGTRRVEIQTPGRAGMAIEWECGKTCARMKIEPKKFSALTQLEFPPMVPGGEAGNYTVRLKVIGGP